jgi:hypothetical protein
MSARGAVFDDAGTKVIGDAFDAVCRKLQGTSYPERVREAIADRVIEIALRSSERDSARLADAVLASLDVWL